MESFFKMSDKQFDDIRLAAGKAKCIGEMLDWTSPDEFSQPESFYHDAGGLIFGEMAKIDKILTAVEERQIEERKQARKGVNHEQG